MLAHQYGWTLSYIMEKVYPEDFFLLSRQIKMRNVDEFLMQARIVANPHAEKETAQEFIDDLMEQRDWFRGNPSTRDKLDRVGLNAFKQQVRQNSKFGRVRQKGEEKPDEVLE